MNDSASESDSNGQRVEGRHYLWVILSLVTGSALAQALMRMGLPVLYPFIRGEFGLSRAQVGLITSFLATGGAIVSILAGWLTDTFGVKRIIAIAMLILTALVFTFPLVYSFPLLLGLALLIGIAVTPMSPAMTRVVIDWFPMKIRALAMSVKQMGVPIAGALTAAVFPALVILIGWRMSAALTGLLILAIAIAFILLYHDAPKTDQVTYKLNLATLKTILWNRGLIITLIWGSTFIGFQYIALSYFMLFLIEDLELSPIAAGGLLATAQVISIFARILWGAVSDFIFHGRRLVILAFTGLLTISWMLGASFIGVGVPSITIYLITIVIGISTLSFHGVFLTSIGEQAKPGHIGLTAGVTSGTVQIAMIVMPPLFGFLVDISGSYSLAWRATAVMALVCTLALLVFGREPQRY